MTDRQTDRQTDARGKTICLPTLSGGDIIKLMSVCSQYLTLSPIEVGASIRSNTASFFSCKTLAVLLTGEHRSSSNTAGQENTEIIKLLCDNIVGHEV